MEEQKMMVTVQIDAAKASDALFIAEGVTNDDIEMTMLYYVNKKDPEVMQIVQQLQAQMM